MWNLELDRRGGIKSKKYAFKCPHSGYLYYIDGYKKKMRSSQTTMIDIKITALKNAIEWHRSPTLEMVGTLVKFHYSVENHSI